MIVYLTQTTRMCGHTWDQWLRSSDSITRRCAWAGDLTSTGASCSSTRHCKLFAEQGVEGVSIRAVNREAGLGPASVHYHFGTKDALVDAVLHVYGDAVIEGIKRARAGDRCSRVARSDARDLVTMLAEPYLDLMATRHEDGPVVGAPGEPASPERSRPRCSTDRRRSSRGAQPPRVYPDAARVRRPAGDADVLHACWSPSWRSCAARRSAVAWTSTC